VKVLITGASGFIGSNLAAQLAALKGYEVLRYGSGSSLDDLRLAIAEADAICHLAGVNRPDDDSEFARVNTDLTRTLCALLQTSGRRLPIIFASSVHVERDNLYGASKLAAEQALLRHSAETGSPVYIFRLPHVIGKWCRPNYNSVVATFCHNIIRDLPIHVDDPSYQLRLVYIDDLISMFVRIIEGESVGGPYCEAEPCYPITVGELADQIRAFHVGRQTLVSERVGTGLTRALYATFISHLPPENFAYSLQKHSDPRGTFVEMLKTRDSGQFSFFTAHPGVTRGSHYHHSKTEKFLVITGHARFRFRNVLTQQVHELSTSGDRPEVVETVPGWVHDITNMGDADMVVMLWANEVFDPERPDTYACQV